MKVLLLLLLLALSSVQCNIQWSDCGFPLSRKLYYQSVVVSPSSVNIASQSSDSSISMNVGVFLQNYVLDDDVAYYVEVKKDGVLYVNVTMDSLCATLKSTNQWLCPLSTGSYSFSYKYTLPPLPTGNYTVKLVSYENFIGGNQIGCLSVSTTVVGLGLDSCSYSSKLSASFAGTANFLNKNSVIQIGPWGPNGTDLGYTWGTFKSVIGTPELIGYNFQANHYVWGLSGSLNSTTATISSGNNYQFSGTIVIGYLPDVNNYANAELIYQGFFTWTMRATSSTPFVFVSGTATLAPTYFYPEDFTYPLNLGNLGTFTITQSTDGTLFQINSDLKWCRCNCDIGGAGHDDILKRKDDSGMSKWMIGTVTVCVVGGVAVIIILFFVFKIRQQKPKPVVYDDADLMEPQKPDYGTMAMGEAFEAEEQYY